MARSPSVSLFSYSISFPASRSIFNLRCIYRKYYHPCQSMSVSVLEIKLLDYCDGLYIDVSHCLILSSKGDLERRSHLPSLLVLPERTL